MQFEAVCAGAVCVEAVCAGAVCVEAVFVEAVCVGGGGIFIREIFLGQFC